MILVDDIHVYINEDMPSGMHEMVSPNPDGTYTILLNGNLSREKQTEAFWHAIWHIEHNDFERVETYGIQIIESQAHARKEIQDGQNTEMSKMQICRCRNREREDQDNTQSQSTAPIYPCES